MTVEERFERIEGLLDRVADTQLQIDGTMATLADSHIKLAEAQAETAVQFRIFQAEMQELKRQFQAYLSQRPQ